jgi:hypothetical protein
MAAAALRRLCASLTHQSSSSFATRATAMSGIQILGMGNPLLDISTVVDADLLEKYGVSTRLPRARGLEAGWRCAVA